MKRLGWLLALVFCCAVDFANPLAAASHEAMESAEEAIHLAGQRRLSRPGVPDRRPPRVGLDRAIDRASRPGAMGPSARVRTPRAAARKVPPPPSASLAAPAVADDPDAH
jgi:hypothetical protein